MPWRKTAFTDLRVDGSAYNTHALFHGDGVPLCPPFRLMTPANLSCRSCNPVWQEVLLRRLKASIEQDFARTGDSAQALRTAIVGLALRAFPPIPTLHRPRS